MSKGERRFFLTTTEYAEPSFSNSHLHVFSAVSHPNPLPRWALRGKLAFLSLFSVRSDAAIQLRGKIASCLEALR